MPPLPPCPGSPTAAPSVLTWLHGASGRMGQEVHKVLTSPGGSSSLQLLGGSSSEQPLAAQVIKASTCKLFIDFSTPAANADLLAFLSKAGLQERAILIATTGLTGKQQKSWHDYAAKFHCRLLFAPNTSLGVLMTIKAAMHIAGICSQQKFDIEVEETHHRYKQDAPSGTAKFLVRGLLAAAPHLQSQEGRQGPRQEGEIGVHASRGGGVFGEHKIRFLGDHEEITISHRAFDRSLWAHGAVVLSRWLLGRPAGSYDLLAIEPHDLLAAAP